MKWKIIYSNFVYAPVYRFPFLLFWEKDVDKNEKMWNEMEMILNWKKNLSSDFLGYYLVFIYMDSLKIGLIN
jgi:hypothetical protein